MRKALLAICTAAALALTSCAGLTDDTLEEPSAVPPTTSETDPPAETADEPDDPSTDDIVEDEPEDEPLTRDNSSAKKATLGAGTHKVPKKLKPGRYVITPASKSQSGNLFIRTDNGGSFVNEILGGSDGFGVPSVTVDIFDGYEIELSGVKATFTPAKTKLSKKLSAGNWIVGMDVPPGDFVAKPGKGQSGNFFVYNEDGRAEVNEILGSEYGVEDVTLTLEIGQIVFISGIPKVTLTDD